MREGFQRLESPLAAHPGVPFVSLEPPWSPRLAPANAPPETFDDREGDLWVRTGTHYGLVLTGGVTANLPVAAPSDPPAAP